MSGCAFPQFARSDDPDVLATVAAAEQQWAAFVERAADFAERHGAPEGRFRVSGWGARVHIVAIETDARPATGKWKRVRNGVYAPFENSPLRREMHDLGYARFRVPGLPLEVRGVTQADGTTVVMRLAPFLRDGVAWYGLPEQPDPGIHPPGPQWVEVLASDYYAARSLRRRPTTRGA